MLKWLLLFSSLTGSVFCCQGQVVSTTDGAKYWDEPTSWATGVVPTSDNSSEVVINHPLIVRAGYVSGKAITVNAPLTIDVEGALGVYGLLAVMTGTINCFGTIHSNTGSSYQTTAQNTNFFDGSSFIHWQSVEGDLPLATWSPSSTYVIKGLDRCISLSSSKWGQALGNLVYECANQGPFMDFKGLLKEIQGDFSIKNTGGGVLILHSTVGAYNLHIGGNFTIEGTSRVWMSETSRNAAIKVDKNLVMNTTVTTASYLTTSGLMTMTVGGDVRLTGTTRLKFCSASNGIGKIFLAGDLVMSNNSIDAIGPGTGEIHFSGSRNQVAKIDSRVLIDGNVNYYVREGSTLDLQQNLLRMSSGGSLTVSGKVVLGSHSVEGALKGNVQFIDKITMKPGATIEYNTDAPQWVAHHAAWPGVNVIVSSPKVTQLSSLQIGGNLVLNGNLDVQQNALAIAGDLTIVEGGLVNCETMVLNGESVQSIDAKGASVARVNVDKPSGEVVLVSPFHISQSLTIRSPNTTVNSSGNLILNSTSTETAAVDVIPPGSTIKGDVIVGRFIPSIGARKYRYLASAVKTASVSLMIDDFPVTGDFSGASTRDSRPSLFRYDESSGRWSPYPTSGDADENTLEPGRGYAAFMFDGEDLTWDVTGELNQGPIKFSVTYTQLDDPFVGWNLVGNPYASPIAWSNAGGWTKSGIAAGIAVRNNSEGNFVYWDGEIGDLPDGIIAAGQAFWVQATGAGASLQVNEAAKAHRDQKFFRANNSAPDYIELQVSMGGDVDRTYLRLRPGASLGNDSFDVQKFDNAALTVALRGTDDKRFAIMATDRLPCRYEVPLIVETASNEETHLNITAVRKGLLVASGLKLFDKRSDQTFDLLSGSIRVAVEPGEDISDRFTLLVQSDSIFNLPVIRTHNICNEEMANLDLIGATPGIGFVVRTNTDTLAHQHADSVYQRVTVDASRMNAGVNKVYIDLVSACYATTSAIETEIVKSSVPQPQVYADVVCTQGSARLWTDDKFEPLDLMWFASETDTARVSRGRQFTTPELSAPVTYYASYLDSVGCESERVAVTVVVRSLEPLSLEWDGAKLTVNYHAPIRWYADGAQIAGVDAAAIYPDRSAIYEAQVLNGECLLTGQRYVEVQPKHSASLLAPNPVYRLLWMTKPAELIDIFDTMGNSVLYLCPLECADNQPCSIDVTHLPEGVYLVRLRSEGAFQTIRVQKL